MFKHSIFILVFGLLVQGVALAASKDSPQASSETAILAGGCFWCMEADFEKLTGVIDVVSGYAGGQSKNPTYKEVSAGGSGHIEVVKVTYDPRVVSYSKILDHFWLQVDPTRDDGQFCDKGSQYRPAIFYGDSTQKKLATASYQNIEKTKSFKAPLKVGLIAADKFYLAEGYHQDYYKKSAYRYNFYRYSCGRDARLKELWAK